MTLAVSDQKPLLLMLLCKKSLAAKVKSKPNSCDVFLTFILEPRYLDLMLGGGYYLFFFNYFSLAFYYTFYYDLSEFDAAGQLTVALFAMSLASEKYYFPPKRYGEYVKFINL